MKEKTMMHVLPVEAYTSQAWFDKEVELIFSRTWAFAGYVEDVAEAGDFISMQAGTNNIFIVKGRDNRLRAFHNMCRHRGTQLLRAVGKGKKAITCPYHDWTYDLEGKLVSVPKQESEFPDLEGPLHECGLNLHEASVDVFKGMLFVHPEKDAPNIMEWFGEVEPFLGPHKVEELVEVEKGKPVYVKEIEANWKVVIENYIDGYHLAHLHEGTLNMYDHDKIECGFLGPHFWFYEPLVQEFMADVTRLSQYPLIDSVPKDKIGAYVPWLFPTLGLGNTESSVSTFHLTPLSPSRTRVTIRAKVMNVGEWEFTKQAARANSSSFWNRIRPKYDGDAESDPMATGDFMAEDVYACEQQQKSFYSSRFSIGAQAKVGEKPVSDFQAVVKNWIEEQEKNG